MSVRSITPRSRLLTAAPFPLLGPAPRSAPGLAPLAVPLAALLAALLAAGPSLAVRARLISDASWEEFHAGEARGVAIGMDGSLTPGPETVKIGDADARSIWALTGDDHGALYVATGDGGRVLRLAASGGKGDPTVLGTLFDGEVFALAGDGRGTWYAAGAPVGTVVKITGDGKTHTLFDVPEGVIFGLLAAPDGTVYAGTGDRGRLYRISASGEGRVLCESPDLSVRCLAWAADGKIVAGTDGRGLVERIDPQDGTIRVLFEATEREIVSVLPRPDGSILFAANPGPGEDGGDAPGSGGGGGIDPPPVGVVGSGVRSAKGAGGDGHAVVYRYRPDGSVNRVWSCPEKLIHAIDAGPGGSAYVATSDDAAVYRVDEDGTATLLWSAEEDQVLSLHAEGSLLFAGTGSPGRVYRLDPSATAEGSFTAKPFDFGDLARWGLLRWSGEPGGSVTAETRTGFTETPDEQWSKWSAVTFDGMEGPVASPPGRYLQWRLTLRSEKGSAPVVRRVEISAVGSNRSPQIANLRLSPDEPAFAPGDASRSGVSQMLPGGIQIDYSLPGAAMVTVSAEDVPSWIRRLRSVVWDAVDPDGDDLRYTIEIREVGKEGFRVLARDISEHAWSMDQGQLPDGLYEIRLTASDDPSNSVGNGLRDTRLSTPFRVDTEAPRLAEVRVVKGAERTMDVRGTATDEASPLRRIEVSIDGEAFRALTPDDGLLDSKRESFRGLVSLRPEQEGNWIVVRAQDAAGNRGAYRAWLEAQ